MKPSWVDLGRMEYVACWRLQQEAARLRADGLIEDTLLFVEHGPVLTLGSSFQESNLLFSPEQYRERGIDVVRTDRGGDVTFHGPKQLVIYPIFNIRNLGADLHKWLRDLEETVIRTLADFGNEGYRFPPNTGVWTGGKKIAAIGIKVSRWISLHGIALNCNNDLSPFGLIVPCGIKEYGVTSLSKETGREISIQDAMPHVVSSFEQVFNTHFQPKVKETFLEELKARSADGKTA